MSTELAGLLPVLGVFLTVQGELCLLVMQWCVLSVISI